MVGREEEECLHVYSAIPGFSESGCPRGRPQHLSPRFPNRNPHLPSIPKPARGHAGRAARESPTPLPTRLANGFSFIPRLGGGPAGSPRAGDRGAGGGGPGGDWAAATKGCGRGVRGASAAAGRGRAGWRRAPAERRPRQPQRQLRREERGRRGERAGRAQRHAEKGQRRRLLPSSARLITRSPLAADLQEQINQRARLDEICCYCAHF